MAKTDEPRLWQQPWFRDLAILAIVFFVLMVVWKVRAILLPVIVGLALAYLANPAVVWIKRRWSLPRWFATLGILFVGAVFFAAVSSYVVPKLVGQTMVLAGNMPRYFQAANRKIDHLLEQATQQAAQDTSPSMTPTTVPAATQPGTGRWSLLASVTPEQWQKIAGSVLTWMGVGVGAVGSVLSVLGYIILAVGLTGICFFYFSWKLDDIFAWFDQFIPPRHRARAMDILGKMDRSVSGWFRGRLMQAGVLGINLCMGWWVVGVPYWLLLGLLGGILNLVPYLAGLTLPVALVLVWIDGYSSSASFDLWRLLWPAVVYAAAQFIDGWVVEPTVQGRATNLDPLTVLLAVLIGGTLLGVLGMILAIPTAACVRILWLEIVLPRLRANPSQSS